MPKKKERAAKLAIPRRLVEFVLLGPADAHRQLQDSPILGDVWLAYAQDPAGRHDLLLAPHWDVTAGHVARAVRTGLKAMRDAGHADGHAAEVAYLHGIVAAKLSFIELLRIVVPLTIWWVDKKVMETIDNVDTRARIRECIDEIARTYFLENAALDSNMDRFSAVERYITLAGIILWGGRQTAEPTTIKKLLAAINAATGEIVEELVELLETINQDWTDGWAAAFFSHAKGGRRGREDQSAVSHLVFQVSRNRRAMPAMEKSIPAVKADAARSLFSVSCKDITWAVIDSGIDANHQTFLDEPGKSRILASYDFTRVRKLISCDGDVGTKDLSDLIAGTDLTKPQAQKYLKQLADGAEKDGPPKWDIIEKFLYLKSPGEPKSHHGTHVAGILGAKNVPEHGCGMCPDIQLYDFRVLAKTQEDTEFAIIAALQYIRYINEQHNFITIHGANLSLSIPHDVCNYACGRTPICIECEKLVESGVVVVAAAGNRGYQYFETQEGTFESYAAFSVTDPGNADEVITVGSTHRFWPHTYGVSYFSSRGPTGDGRLKPDLVAPGERIKAPVPGNSGDGERNEWRSESGTSMAAPHVSGAAAMLMARHPELVGQPRRIKLILCQTATDLGRERTFQGHGMLDVLRALQSV